MTPFSGRVAHMSLRGVVDAPLTEGEGTVIILPVADLLDAPAGSRDRQLLLGEAVTVIDRERGFAFVQAAKDGYCGWLAEVAVGPFMPATHWVASPATHLYSEPRVQAPELAAISLGARVTVTGWTGIWAETPIGFVPAVHLRPIGDWAEDPVSVAESLIGTPYLWGGNSRSGLDCSGLVQLSLYAAGIACPADSDLQEAVGAEVPEGTMAQRGDLIFWKGHVAMAVDSERLIHANGHTMSVAYEGTHDCTTRISQQGGGAVTARRRP